MVIIQKKYYKADKILGQQKRKDGSPLRFLTYCLVVPCDDGILLHNVMTKEMILLKGEECDRLNTANLNASPVLQQGDSPLFDYLFANWYIVPETHDDKALCLSLRTVVRHLQEAKLAGKKNAFTILTTTACNARCFYCYERGAKYEDMSRVTAQKVLEYIKRNCAEKSAFLAWYGGEPLFNLEPIELITEGLQKEGIRYSSSMTSNGYLFDEALVNKAREKWHLWKVQITLDGTEETYNKRKAYIYKGVNAFQRVTDNIELLLKAGIHVNVRLNLDEKNYDDLLVLADYLTARYGKYGRYSAYSRYLNFDAKNCTCHEDINPITKCMLTLNERLGMKKRRHRLDSHVSIYQCMSDNPASVLIQTNGDLGKCQHFFNSRSYGSIDKGICDAEELKRAKEADIDLVRCNSCPIYPSCTRIAICLNSFANNNGKTAIECADRVDETRASMLTCYEGSLKKGMADDL